MALIMSVRIHYLDQLRESLIRHGRFFQGLSGNFPALAVVLIFMISLASISLLWAAPVAAFVLLLSIVAAAPLPSIRSAALRRKVSETRASLLEKNSLVLEILGNPRRNRYNRLHGKVARLSDMLPEDPGSVVKPGEYLLWLYLKLLLAQDHLESNATGSSSEALHEEKMVLETDLRREDLSEVTRQAKQQTIHLLEQRMNASRMRAIRTEEVESDLIRIEHQLALLCDRAAEQSPLADAGYRIDLAAEPATTASCGELPGGAHVQQVEEIFFQHLTS